MVINQESIEHPSAPWCERSHCNDGFLALTMHLDQHIPPHMDCPFRIDHISDVLFSNISLWLTLTHFHSTPFRPPGTESNHTLVVADQV